MPAPIENDSMIPTLDRQGAIWLYTDHVTAAYLDFVEGKVALEIAAGYGHVVTQALDRGARRIFANEIDAGQLEIIRSRTPGDYRDRLVCCLGEFPEHVDFEPSSFDAIYSARLLHFFDGQRIRTALDKIARWLTPGGNVFLVSDSVYRTIFKPLIPIYERRVADGDPWPGFFDDVSACIAEAVHPDNFPKKMNFLDPTVLTRELSRAGLDVEAAAFYPYTGNFAPGRLDGRELAGAIARKPRS
jgi:hypothetical protein